MNYLEPAIKALDLGCEADKQGDAHAAMQHFSHAIDLDPTFDLAFNNRGWIRWKLGDVDGAISDALQSYYLNPTRIGNLGPIIERHKHRAFQRLSAGNAKGAHDDLSIIIEGLQELDSESLRCRGMIALESGQLSRAWSDFDLACRRHQEEAENFVGRAQTLKSIGDHFGACTDLRHAHHLGSSRARELLESTCRRTLLGWRPTLTMNDRFARAIAEIAPQIRADFRDELARLATLPIGKSAKIMCRLWRKMTLAERLTTFPLLLHLPAQETVGCFLDVAGTTDSELRFVAREVMNAADDRRHCQYVVKGLESNAHQFEFFEGYFLNLGIYAGEVLGNAIASEANDNTHGDKGRDFVNSGLRVLGRLSDSTRFILQFVELPDYRESALWALDSLAELSLYNLHGLVSGLANWTSGPTAALCLNNRQWKPVSSRDIVRMWVAERSGMMLREHWNEARAILLEDLNSESYCVVENAVFALIGLGMEGTIDVLEERLNASGTKHMAEAYLNSHHHSLDKAARAWASQRGYTISRGPGAQPVTWGGL